MRALSARVHPGSVAADGTLAKQRILFVSHCARGERIRIISARKSTRRERSQYAKRIGENG
ncbi:MAG: BrnT family toxin [Terriglobia bacterium]